MKFIYKWWSLIGYLIILIGVGILAGHSVRESELDKIKIEKHTKFLQARFPINTDVKIKRMNIEGVIISSIFAGPDSKFDVLYKTDCGELKTISVGYQMLEVE